MAQSDLSYRNQQRCFLYSQERQRLVKGKEEEAAKETVSKGRAIKRDDVKFTTALGRSVFDCIFHPPRSDVREMYLPRRTAFVYEFEGEDAEALESDLPTTLRRSKADCPLVSL